MANNPVHQKITIPNIYGEKLVGVLHDTGSKGIVVLCHGLAGSKDDAPIPNLAAALEKEGISAFRFDFAGNGESEGLFQYGHYSKEAEDIRAIIKHFTLSGNVIRAILGHSKGANVVLLYASKFHDIETVINVSGRYQLERGITQFLGDDFMERIKRAGFIDMDLIPGKLYRVTEESLMDRLRTNMHEACQQIDDKCRVLTIHGSADEIIPVEDAHEFSKIIKNHKLEIIDGSDHCYKNHQSELAATVVDFIKSGFKIV